LKERKPGKEGKVRKENKQGKWEGNYGREEGGKWGQMQREGGRTKKRYEEKLGRK
jgi:hypothetical protein